MKKVAKNILAASLPLFLFSCSSSPVNEHPTKKNSSEEAVNSKSSPSTEESSIVEESQRVEESSMEDPKEKTYKVLFIGNSFTFYNDLESVTEAQAKSAGLTNFSAERVASSAYHLYQHADAADPTGAIVDEKLKTGEYTHIILQEHSTSPVSNYASFLEGATSLVNKIRTYQPSASIRLYETWGYQGMVGNYGNSIASCEDALCEGYVKVAKALTLDGVHYVGKAFTKSLSDNPSINLYYSGDDKHPSFAGTYLSGLIHLSSITGIDLNTVSFQGESGKYNAYGETYVSNEAKSSLIDTASSIIHTWGTAY